VLIFYGIALAIILGAGLLVFFLLRRRGHVLAVGVSLVTLAVFVLIWPIPIHGGFTILGEVMFDEWSREWDRSNEVRSDHEQQAYIESFAQRFVGELPILGREPARYGWQAVTYSAGRPAWLDADNGQIWSDWLELAPTPSLPALEVAKARCEEYAPVGYWSLPTEAEHALMWKAEGHKVLPAAEAGSVSFIVDSDFRMEFATYHVGVASDNGSRNARGGSARRFAVHCVALGPGGPARGYLQQDIPLDDWNRYQLSKSGSA
jgi:hypothetical protein